MHYVLERAAQVTLALSGMNELGSVHDCDGGGEDAKNQADKGADIGQTESIRHDSRGEKRPSPSRGGLRLYFVKA